MRSRRLGIACLLACSLAALAVGGCGEKTDPLAPAWVEPMKKVHARFTGTRGTFAHFGDSITASDAFWARLRRERAYMQSDMAEVLGRVKGYMKPECWDKWKGEDYGNEGSTTVDWACGEVDTWLARINPEVVLILFGTNDMRRMDARHYERQLRRLVERCLDNGSVVILTTPPPRHGYEDTSRQFADAVRRVADEERVPLIDYQAAILTSRPDDWDGALPQFRHTPGDEYQVPTLISRDGVHPSNPVQYSDYSDLGLRNNGYILRTYLTLFTYADVINRVLRPSWLEASELGRWLGSFLRVMAVVGVVTGVVLGLEQLLKRARP
jgi:lysophospholipase L1-like esterase